MYYVLVRAYTYIYIIFVRKNTAPRVLYIYIYYSFSAKFMAPVCECHVKATSRRHTRTRGRPPRPLSPPAASV